MHLCISCTQCCWIVVHEELVMQFEGIVVQCGGCYSLFVGYGGRITRMSWDVGCDLRPVFEQQSTHPHLSHPTLSSSRCLCSGTNYGVTLYLHLLIPFSPSVSLEGKQFCLETYYVVKWSYRFLEKYGLFCQPKFCPVCACFGKFIGKMLICIAGFVDPVPYVGGDYPVSLAAPVPLSSCSPAR